MLYEAMLLFGVVFITSWLFDTLTQSRHALMLRDARMLVLFLVLGWYFIYFWRRGGQTLAMKTWHIKLIMPGEARIPFWRALLRYCLIWMWFLPAMALSYLLDLKGWASVLAVVCGMVLWTLTIFLYRDRQFLQDRLAGTRLVEFVPPTPPKKTKKKK